MYKKSSKFFQRHDLMRPYANSASPTDVMGGPGDPPDDEEIYTRPMDHLRPLHEVIAERHRRKGGGTKVDVRRARRQIRSKTHHRRRTS